MTPERRKSPRVFLGIASAVLVASITWLVATAWATKANVLDVQALDRHENEALVGHIAADHVVWVQDSAWKAGIREITLELLCRDYPLSRKCRAK